MIWTTSALLGKMGGKLSSPYGQKILPNAYTRAKYFFKEEKSKKKNQKKSNTKNNLFPSHIWQQCSWVANSHLGKKTRLSHKGFTNPNSTISINKNKKIINLALYKSVHICMFDLLVYTPLICS